MENQQLTICENAILFPALNDWTGGLYIHGIQSPTPHQDPIHFGNVKFGKSLIDKEARKNILETTQTPHKLSGHHLYMGALSFHFGHLLGECISRLWATEINLDHFESLIFLPSNLNQNSKSTIKDILTLFKIDQSRIKYITELTVIEKLTIPEPGKLFGEKSKGWYLDFLYRQMSPEKFKRELPKKIFVSRRNYKLVGRTAGLDYLIKLLSDVGYFELCPEKYPIQRQLEFICSADKIIWEEGSACHLLELLPEITSVNVLIQRRPTENYNYFVELLGEKCKNLFIYSDVEFCKSSKPPHNRMSTLKNPGTLIKLINEHTQQTINYSEPDFKLNEAIDLIEDSFTETKDKEIIDILAARLHNMKPQTQLTEKQTIERSDLVPNSELNEIKSWAIDTPARNKTTCEPFTDIRINGWIIIHPDKYQEGLLITARNNKDEKITTNLTIRRPDVIKANFGTSENHPQINCGFTLNIPFSFGSFDISATGITSEQPLSHIKVKLPSL